MDAFPKSLGFGLPIFMLVIEPVRVIQNDIEPVPLPRFEESLIQFPCCKQFFIVAFPAINKFTTKARIDAIAGPLIIIESFTSAELQDIGVETVLSLEQFYADEIVFSAHGIDLARAFDGRVRVVSPEVVERFR